MWCGCFCCLQIFRASDVIDWIDDGDTPLCPHCGMAALLPDVTDLETLWKLRERRFPSGNTFGDSKTSGR
jgi:hypothetical protein